jgi:hypothetical protein
MPWALTKRRKRSSTVVVVVIAEVNYPQQIQPNGALAGAVQPHSAHAGAVTQKPYNCNTDCATLSFMKNPSVTAVLHSGMDVLLPILSIFVTDLGVNWCTRSLHNATE